MAQLNLSVPIRQVPLSRFGGLYTEADERDLPLGASPLISDCDFIISKVTIRPGLVPIQAFLHGGTISPTATLLYIRGTLFTWLNSIGPVNIFQASDGTFWVDYETSGTATLIYSGMINNPRMLSETFAQYEYACLGNWGDIQNRIPLQGVDQPRTFTVQTVGSPTEVQFDRISQTAPQSNEWAVAVGGTTGTTAPLTAGPRWAVMMYQMRNGYITPASMPIAVTGGGSGGSTLTFTNLPTGPPEAQYIIIAVSIAVPPAPAGSTLPANAGIGGPYFWIPLNTPNNDSTIFVNGTHTATVTTSDVDLTAGINITVPGNFLLTGHQRELGECVKVVNYGGRAFFLGERTKVDNLKNMTFDAGFEYNNADIPGWTQIGSGLTWSLQPSPIYGLTLVIDNTGTSGPGGGGTVNPPGGGGTTPPGAPSDITPTTGTPQSTIINTQFASALQATVTDTQGNLLSGVNVTFVAPTVGPSGTFGNNIDTVLTDQSGNASVVFTANGIAGTYSVTASVQGLPGTATFVLTNLVDPPGATYQLPSFGTVGQGGDDTTVLQNALNSTAAAGGALQIPAGHYIIGPVTLPASSYVIVDANVTVSARAGYGANDRMINITGNNTTIKGAGATTSVFQMPLAQQSGVEQRHCFYVNGATNVLIQDVSGNQSGGDGVYIARSTNVTVQNCIFDRNFRQGCSITDQVNHIYLLACSFTNTSGTAPQCGIDVEPNTQAGSGIAPANNFVRDVNITDCITSGNAGDGILFSLQNLTSATPAISINILNHQSIGNVGSGYRALNNDPTNAPGTIMVVNSSSSGDGAWGAVGRFYKSNGAVLIFQNFTVTNPNSLPPTSSNYGDKSAVAIMRGGGGTGTIGNVQFNNISITANSALTDRYFNFQDFSSGGGIALAVFHPNIVSGAALAPPNGLVMGQGFNTVG